MKFNGNKQLVCNRVIARVENDRPCKIKSLRSEIFNTDMTHEAIMQCTFEKSYFLTTK